MLNKLIINSTLFHNFICFMILSADDLDDLCVSGKVRDEQRMGGTEKLRKLARARRSEKEKVVCHNFKMLAVKG